MDADNTAGQCRPDDATLDAAVIDDMCEFLGEETVHEVVGAFLTGTRGFIDLLRASLERGDSPDAVVRLHRLVGSAGAVGATSLATLCRENERRLLDANGAPVSADIDLDGIDRSLGDARAALIQRVPGAVSVTG